MDDRIKTWLIRGGIGAGACALLTAWMVPNTTPLGRPSPLAAMQGTAEASKPTYSAVPDSAIPGWAANLQQMPSAAPQVATAPPQQQVADPLDSPPTTFDAPDAPDQTPAPEPQPVDIAPPPVIAEAAPPAAPAAPARPRDDYQARRAAWQARVDAVMRGQRGPADPG